MPVIENRGSELRRLRDIAAASQWDLGSRIGLSVNEVSQLELGRRPLDDELFDRCKSALVQITAERHEAAVAAMGVPSTPG